MFMKFGLLGLVSQVLFVLSLLFIGLWVLGQVVLAFWPWLLGIAGVWGMYRVLRWRTKA